MLLNICKYLANVQQSWWRIIKIINIEYISAYILKYKILYNRYICLCYTE